MKEEIKSLIEEEKILLFKDIEDINDYKFILSLRRIVKNFKKYKKGNV